MKVADFGLAKLVEGGTELAAGGLPAASSPALTESGKIMGTPQYMAPEQVAHPLEVDHRADIYSLGVVFYQMLTGELPGKKIEPPSSKVQIDVRLDEVVLRALEKNPELRYQQVSEVKTCVETIATTPAGKAVSAIPSSLSFADEKRIREQVKAPAIGLLVAGGLNLIALLVGAVGMFVELLFMHPAVHFGPPVGHAWDRCFLGRDRNFMFVSGCLSWWCSRCPQFLFFWVHSECGGWRLMVWRSLPASLP